MKIKKSYFFILFLVLGITQMVGCSDSDTSSGKTYDPSKPIELATFYPDSGKYLEKVILTGSNFGTKPDSIRVYFNSKKAAVVGSTGEKMYVLAPRLPGDTCIISVAIGKDSLSYSNIFRYSKSVTVSTIAGNGSSSTIVTGSLSGTSLQPYYVCCDKDDNVFAVSRNGGTSGSFGILRIDEENDEMVMLDKGVTGNVPCAAPTTGIITIPTETTIGSFISLDPMEFWAPRIRELKWPDGYDIPANGYKHCFVVNPADGFIYTRYYYGDIIKINPKTYEVTPLMKTQQGDSYGLTFNPLHPNLLYISFWSNAGDNANSICTVDVTDAENTFHRISSTNISGGHRDGEMSKAQFSQPAQIFCDADGNIYVADYGNHCIRRITSDNMVETVLGVPGRAGWKDGTKEEALFYYPRGIGINSTGAVYVADYGNMRIRKLTIN
jgi:hypothetical protein